MNHHFLSTAVLWFLPFCAGLIRQTRSWVLVACIRLRAPTKHKIFRRIAPVFLLAGLVFWPVEAAFANGAKTPQAWQEYLETQMRLLQQEIMLDPEVIADVKRANIDNAHFAQKEIFEIDRQWREKEGVDLFIVSLITNDIADKLKAFQREHRGLAELFMTDQKGLLIAATNKTSDFYQADEDWWQTAFRQNNPNGFFGDVEYDESALVEDVPVYLVMRDERQAVIGVLKAVFNKNKILNGAL